MEGVPPKDGDNVIDWGKTSRDYSDWRPNYPDRFFEILTSFGVGLPGQRILDLGTGVGFLALQFARQGVVATGVDISEGQIEEAKGRAASLGFEVDFRVSPAEDTGLPTSSFDFITASQAWLYFDKDRMISEVKRLLRPGRTTGHFPFFMAATARPDCADIGKTGFEAQSELVRSGLGWNHANDSVVVRKGFRSPWDVHV